MKIIFVRHGETDWNKQKKYQGITDIPLNTTGEQQAAKTAEDVFQLLEQKKQSVMAIYSSNLARAKRTAEIIGARLNISEIVEDKRLQELNFGLWEGLSFTEVFAQYQPEFDSWYQDAFAYQVPNGESLSQVVERAMEAVNEIAANHIEIHEISASENAINNKQRTVMIVTHGGVIKSLCAHFDKNFDLWNSDVKLASVTECTYEKGCLHFR